MISDNMRHVFAVFITLQLLFSLFFWRPVSAQQEIFFDQLIKQVQPPVFSPFPDGVDQTIPSELGNQAIAAFGFVDVTAKPFMADNTGRKDSTRAIQQAVNFSRDHQMVCFFPSGKYRISDTISCAQKLYRRTNKQTVPGRNFPCLLVGSRQGKRPEIILSPNSVGFQDPDQPKFLIHFWAHSNKSTLGPQPNISFNQMFVNIDLTVGPGNPGAIAIRHRGAQGSAIQESTINVINGHAGIQGGCGSGGGFAAITIFGGTVGMDLRETQPAATITGITLINQKKVAILYKGRQTLTAVGIKIVSSAKGPVIIGKPVTFTPFHGIISLIDSQIIFNHSGSVAISTENSLFMKNVYIKNVQKLISNPDGYIALGSINNWIHVKEYALGIKPKKCKGYQFETPVYIDGKRQTNHFIIKESGKKPPENLQARHLWKSSFPDWQSPGTVNVKLSPYNAKGNGIHDDTKAIQKAINENELVFFPKGYYKLSKTLVLKENSKLIGVGRHLSIFMAENSKPLPTGNPFPLVQTVNQKNAETIISFCGFYIPRENINAYMIDWQCGGASIVRATNFFTKPYNWKKYKKVKSNHPLVLIRKNGGGKWYNFFQEDKGRHHGLRYRHLMLQDGNGPIAFYQCNPEHAKSQANMEINNYKHVSIYGLKGESPSPILMVNDSDHISVFGYGGNAYGHKNKAIFQIKNTPNFLISNAVDAPSPKKHPDTWHMIIDEPIINQAFRTLPLERPVLFKRGTPEEG